MIQVISSQCSHAVCKLECTIELQTHPTGLAGLEIIIIIFSLLFTQPRNEQAHAILHLVRISNMHTCVCEINAPYGSDIHFSEVSIK